MNAGDAEKALIFAWERVRRIPVILPGFLLLSFVAHVVAFFLFRVVYPAQASLPLPQPTVTLLDPSRPDHQALLRWAEAEDPTPTIQTKVTERLLTVNYRPSYETVRTAPLTLAPEVGRVQYPPARDPLRLIRSVEATPKPLPQPPSTAGTRVAFTGALAERAKAPASVSLKIRSAQPLEPADFLVGVTEGGEVRYVVLQRSSGSRELDTEAAEHLRQVQLSPAESPMTWGHARVHWGADAYRTTGK
jgi:hypothetical protein